VKPFYTEELPENNKQQRDDNSDSLESLANQQLDPLVICITTRLVVKILAQATRLVVKILAQATRLVVKIPVQRHFI
jgi:flagellar biosynthesis/type III secretory pathway protein FliH